jgi:hypothetical protein
MLTKQLTISPYNQKYGRATFIAKDNVFLVPLSPKDVMSVRKITSFANTFPVL